MSTRLFSKIYIFEINHSLNTCGDLLIVLPISNELKDHTIENTKKPVSIENVGATMSLSPVAAVVKLVLEVAEALSLDNASSFQK